MERESGHFSGLVTNLVKAQAHLGVPYEVISRLATNAGEGTIERIVQLAHTDWLAINPQKPSGAVAAPEDDGLTVLDAPSAYMTYVMTTYNELQRRFPGHVDSEYSGGVVFTLIPERANTVREPRTLPFKYVRRNRFMTDAKMIAAMAKHGLLPALPDEELDFLKDNPAELQLGRAIWALGARHGVSRVLVAWNGGFGRKLGLSRTDDGWAEGALFLAVPQGALGISDALPSV